MIRQTIYTILLLAIHLTVSGLTAAEGTAYQYLREPAVEWNNSRLTGEVKNAPVKSLITEILQKGGSNWEVTGNLNGTTWVFFNHLTINDSIKKIMRLSGLNYVLIFEEHQPHDSGNSSFIKELTIYQGKETIRFSRTARQISPPERQIVEKTFEPATDDPAGKPKVHEPQPAELRNDELAQMDRELKAFAAEMLAEEKITAEEYQELMEDLEAER